MLITPYTSSTCEAKDQRKLQAKPSMIMFHNHDNQSIKELLRLKTSFKESPHPSSLQSGQEEYGVTRKNKKKIYSPDRQHKGSLPFTSKPSSANALPSSSRLPFPYEKVFPTFTNK